MTESRIKIKLITRDENTDLHVPDSSLYVGTSLKRYGLSEIVNHLIQANLGTEEDMNPVPFNFLIDGVLLRGSINDYLVKNGLSNEVFLTLEYTRCILPPSWLASFNDEDWVSSVSIKPSGNQILSGGYDGVVRVWNDQGKVQNKCVGHKGSVKDVKWLQGERLVSCGTDRELRLWKFQSKQQNDSDDEAIDIDFENDGKVIEAKTIAVLQGHTAPVESLAVNLKANRILSASSDNSLGLWSTNHKEMTSIDPTLGIKSLTSTASQKRRRLATKDVNIRHKSPLSLLEGHTQSVMNVCFAPDATVGYSVSLDHTIKTWDLVTSKNVSTMITNFSLLSILSMDKLGLLVCGSSARHLSLHDPRSIDKIEASKLTGHTNFVVGLAASPENDYALSSCSHDGTVRVWDIRAQKSLFVIKREKGDNAESKDIGGNKVFGIDWNKEVGIVSGGMDKQIQINRGTELTSN